MGPAPKSYIEAVDQLRKNTLDMPDGFKDIVSCSRDYPTDSWDDEVNHSPVGAMIKVDDMTDM